MRDEAFSQEKILFFRDSSHYGIVLRGQNWAKLFFSPLTGEWAHA